MPTSPLDRQPHDLGIRFVAPSSVSDKRVPTAEELTLGTQILFEAICRSRLQKGWLKLPDFSVNAPRQVVLADGKALLPITSQYEIAINTAIDIPALSNTFSVVKQDDHLSLVGVATEVGADQDPVLGQLTYQYLEGQTVKTTVGENTRRYRSFWLLVLSPVALKASDFINALPVINGEPRLTISNTSSAGFPVGGLQIYPHDPLWTLNESYSIVTEVQILPLCKIRRLQNFTDRGYTAGNNGEEPLSANFNIIPFKANTGASQDDIVRQRINQLFAGQPGGGASYARTVQNLTAGTVAGNPGNSGESAGSPNGSVCLANDQRVSFTNQGFTQKLGVQIVTAGNDGNGNALITASLNTNAPAGSYFSETASDHRIYRADGVEVSASGNFQNLGGTGSLIWTSDSNAGLLPGQQVYFAPGVKYPAGSGFSIPFVEAEQVWVSGTSLGGTIALQQANVRNGYDNDLEAYAAPAGNQDFIVVLGPERAALHYIYKKVSFTTGSNGVALIPSNERGCFAFIEGVSGRIDAPVYRGLAANTTYNALVYYPPRTLESWQFRFKYPEYGGTGEAAFLNGAKVVSKPLFFIHTQGGGGQVFQGDAAFRYSPIAMNLPAVAGGIPAYRLYLPCQGVGENYPGPITLREMPLLSGAGFAVPAPGQVLSFVEGSTNQPRSVRGRLFADGKPVGFRTPLLNNNAEFQAVLAFAVEKGEEQRLIVLTRNSAGNENAAANSDEKTAIDLFRL